MLKKFSNHASALEEDIENHTNIEINYVRRADLRFKLRDDLIYYINFNDDRERLCISKALETHIFHLAHDMQHHEDYHRSYDRIVNLIYMRHLQKHLRQYIEHCPHCELNQIKRHKLYDHLKPLNQLSILFHIIIMNFIVVLSNAEEMNSLLTIIDKFSKRILLLSD